MSTIGPGQSWVAMSKLPAVRLAERGVGRECLRHVGRDSDKAFEQGI